MTNETVGIAIVGCGAITQKRHGPECKKNPYIELKGFYDLLQSRAEETAAAFGGKAYASFDELLDDDSVDGVIVCVANQYHARYSIAALEKGKHVLCEKPIATTEDDARAMVAAADKSGRYLMVAHSQRCGRAYQTAKEILNRGDLGRILGFRATMAHGGPESWSVDGGSSWFFKAGDAGLGAMGDLGIHKADLIPWLLGDDIAYASAFFGNMDKKCPDGSPIGLEDYAVCLLESKRGIAGPMEASWIRYAPMEDTMLLYCENGTMQITIYEEDHITIHYRDGGVARITPDDSDSLVSATFANCIRTKTPPELDGKEGLKALHLVMACKQAAETHSRVQV